MKTLSPTPKHIFVFFILLCLDFGYHLCFKFTPGSAPGITLGRALGTVWDTWDRIELAVWKASTALCMLRNLCTISLALVFGLVFFVLFCFGGAGGLLSDVSGGLGTPLMILGLLGCGPMDELKNLMLLGPCSTRDMPATWWHPPGLCWALPTPCGAGNRAWVGTGWACFLTAAQSPKPSKNTFESVIMLLVSIDGHYCHFSNVHLYIFVSMSVYFFLKIIFLGEGKESKKNAG